MVLRMGEVQMKWYDYGMCVLFANTISAGVLHGSIFALTFGVLSFILYEEARKGVNDGNGER
jgi:hypothetical protein